LVGNAPDHLASRLARALLMALSGRGEQTKAQYPYGKHYAEALMHQSPE